MTLVRFAPKPVTRSRISKSRSNAFCRNTPAINIFEQDDSYKIQLAVPGIPKEQVQLEVKDDQLTIEAIKPEIAEGDTEINYLRKEYDFAAFKKVFNLNDEINQEAIAATLIDGVLTITLDKKEEAKAIPPKSITIK